jgi:hypothetical protein
MTPCVLRDRDRREQAAALSRGALSLGALMVLLTSACSKLDGFGGDVPPLATLSFQVDGDLGPLRPPGDTGEKSLQVALVWGAQWLTEPFCILPPESAAAADVIVAGCRDPFGFVPDRVAANTPIELGVTGSIELFDLPAADVMVGDVTARVAYGSLVVYDDRDGDGTLDLARPHRTPSGGPDGGGPGGGMNDFEDSTDVVYGASFVTMTKKDQRVAYREGAFNAAAAFYPRSGCGDPLPAFSIVAAGGFSPEAGLASAATGMLPPEDPATCAESAPSDIVVTFRVQAPADAQEVSCIERTADSSVRYREPPTDAPDLTGRKFACAHLPAFDAGDQSQLIQLVISGRSTDRCMGLTHYTLRGCREDVACALPEWDYTANPPAWWPCPVQ